MLKKNLMIAGLALTTLVSWNAQAETGQEPAKLFKLKIKICDYAYGNKCKESVESDAAGSKEKLLPYFTANDPKHINACTGKVIEKVRAAFEGFKTDEDYKASIAQYGLFCKEPLKLDAMLNITIERKILDAKHPAGIPERVVFSPKVGDDALLSAAPQGVQIGLIKRSSQKTNDTYYPPVAEEIRCGERAWL